MTSRRRDAARYISGRQGRVVRRALRDAIETREGLARSVEPFRSIVDKRISQRDMKRAGEYRRVLKALTRRTR